jgi:hypothetical protein
MADFSFVEPPLRWTVMLQRLQRVFPEALIGGGCLRDLHFSRAINDIDVFIDGSQHGPGSDGLRTTIERVTNCRTVLDRTVTHNNVIYPQTIGSVFCFGFEGEKYQVVQKNHTFMEETLLQTFDIGLCMIDWNGFKYEVSPYFTVDAVLKRLTLVNPKEHSSLGHQHRVRSKYPDFQWCPERDDNLVRAMTSLTFGRAA